MAQITPLGFQNILNLTISLKQELKEKKELLKNDPASYADFSKKIDNCRFHFEQIQKSAITCKNITETVHKQLLSISTKLQNCAPQSQKPPLLLDIAEQFKAHKTQEAMAAFSKFEMQSPQDVEKVFENLWQLKGRPEKITSKKELFYSALDIERAEAIVSCLSSPDLRLQDIGNLFATGKEAEALIKFNEFARVYPKVADHIYGKVWEVYNRPTKENHLAHIADEKFGYVAFHNCHPKDVFKVKWAHNATAIQWTVSDLPKLLSDPKFLVEQNTLRLDHRCVEVANETIDLFKKGEYTSRDGQKHNLKDYLQFSTEQTRIYREAGSCDPKKPRFAHTLFEVRSQNCVEMAYDLSFRGGNTLVLNLANSFDFGGAYLKARGTQEEEISRCTGLAPAVNKHHGVQLKEFYPLHSQNHAGPAGGLYTPQVLVIRMGMQNDYQFYDQPMPIAIATFAAYDKPELDWTDSRHPRMQGEKLKWTREKVRTIYQCAYENGHDTLVLGAFGCGAFANPPDHIAELFKDAGEKEYKGCFRYIGFAVLEDMSDGKAHNPEGNFKPFERMVQQQGGQAYKARGEIVNG